MYKDVCACPRAPVQGYVPTAEKICVPASSPLAPCSLVSGLVGGFWALNLVPEILSLLGELALRTK